MLEDRKNGYCCRCPRIFGSSDVALGHINKEHCDWWLRVDTKKDIKADKPFKGHVGFLINDDPQGTKEAEEVKASLEAEPAGGQKRGGSSKEKDLKSVRHSRSRGQNYPSFESGAPRKLNKHRKGTY